MHHPDFLSPPEIGSVYRRDDGQLGRFESMVIALNIRQDDWSAHLMTDNGVEYITRADFQNPKAHDGWRPAAWRWDSAAFRFAPRHLEWDAKKQEWKQREVEAEEEVGEALPPRAALPKPGPEEHHATWRARCRRKFPSLDSDEGRELLGEYWNEVKAQD